jgi:hypothetical protein
MLKGKLGRIRGNYTMQISELSIGSAGCFQDGAVALRLSNDSWLNIKSNGDVVVEHAFGGWLPVTPLTTGSEIILTII